MDYEEGTGCVRGWSHTVNKFLIPPSMPHVSGMILILRNDSSSKSEPPKASRQMLKLSSGVKEQNPI